MSEIDRNKSSLFPLFARLLEDFEARLRDLGLPFHLFEGYRSWERQAELYAQGRGRPGRIVTRARPGQSWHNYGFAADYVLDGITDKPGIQWSWDIKTDLNADGRGDWLQMAELAVSMGLESAWFWRTFPEAPHVQLRYGFTLAKAQELYNYGGLSSVWNSAVEWLARQEETPG